MTTTAPRPTAVGALRERVIKFAERVTTPLVPADYLDVIDPLRSSADLRGRIVAIHPETRDAVTVVIKPGRGWRGHTPGQYVRIGVDVDGVRQWRAYSLTSHTTRRQHRHHREGHPRRRRSAITWSAGPRSAPSSNSTRPPATSPSATRPPAKILFLTAGSGITPVMGMLRNMTDQRRRRRGRALRPHRQTTSIFGGELRMLARARPNPVGGEAHRHRRHARRRAPRRLGRRLRRASDVGLRPRRHARRARRPLGCRRYRRSAAHRAVPADGHHRRRRRHRDLRQVRHRRRRRRHPRPCSTPAKPRAS